MIRNYISMQMWNFWGSVLEGQAVFELFVPHWLLGCPKANQKMGFQKKMPQLNFTCNIQYLGKILTSNCHFIENGQIWPPFLTVFWPPGPWKWCFHGKLLLVQSDFEKESICLWKTAEKLTSPKLSKRFSDLKPV